MGTLKGFLRNGRTFYNKYANIMEGVFQILLHNAVQKEGQKLTQELRDEIAYRTPAVVLIGISMGDIRDCYWCGIPFVTYISHSNLFCSGCITLQNRIDRILEPAICGLTSLALAEKIKKK